MSAPQTVLLAMSQTPARDRLVEDLEATEIRVLISETLDDALKDLRYKRPELVIGSADLNGITSVELVGRLRDDPRGALLPLLISVEEPDERTRIDLFEAGADVVLSRDVSLDELVARVRTMLKRYRRLGAVLPDAETIDRRKITFLRQWALNPSEVMKPAPSVESHLGYTYEKAREHFGCMRGAEVEHLEDLATRMCLERTFFDRVHLCSQCGHHAINFREVAPKSKSPDIARVEMIRHLTCGHVAPRRAYADGPKRVCPKCHEELDQPGVDYEEIDDLYIDNETGEVFAEPDVDCVCLSCGYFTDPNRLARRNVFSYSISERGLLAAETGFLYDISLDSVLMDYDLQVYNPSYFQRQLSIEMERARRYRHPLSLAIVCLDQYENFLQQYGEPSRRYLAQVAQTLKNSTRASDIIARYEHHSVIVLFPETDLKGAGRAVEKVRNEVLKLKSSRVDVQLTVSCGVSAYPDAADNQQMLVKSATTCYSRAREMGGNVVVTAEPRVMKRS